MLLLQEIQSHETEHGACQRKKKKEERKKFVNHVACLQYRQQHRIECTLHFGLVLKRPAAHP
jgi:hypothetical protein